MNAARGACPALLLGLIAAAQAAEPTVPVDAEFLEFLGSLDTEEEEWREFLAERPLEAEEREPTREPAVAPPRKEAAADLQKPAQEKVRKP